MLPELELPRLSLDEDGSGVRFHTDDALFQATGVRIGFTERAGGFSAAPYDSLNLGRFAGEGESPALRNIHHLMKVVGAPAAHLLNPKQVHGTELVTVLPGDDVRQAQDAAEAGADGVVVDVADVFALLCFADCAPLIMASPDGAFAVAHAGWRGTHGRIASKTLRALASAVQSQRRRKQSGACGGGVADIACSINIYLGPYIHAECFEVGEDTRALFEAEFGAVALASERHVDLKAALIEDLVSAGADPERIADAGFCTVCDRDRFYSYRAEGGTCGRHGAFAFRTAPEA